MTRRGLLLFVAMCVIWGIPYLFIRIAVHELTPATLVFLRTAIAAIVLLPIAIRRGGFRNLFDKWRPLAMFALIEIGVPWLSISTAEKQISSSLAGLLISAVPLVGVLIAPLFGNRERIGSVNLAGPVSRPGRRGGHRRSRSSGYRLAASGGDGCGRGRLRRRPGDPGAISLGPAGGEREHGRARPVCGCICAGGGAAVATSHPEHGGAGVGSSARAGLQLARVPHLLRSHRRDRARPRHRHHLNQPGGGRSGRDFGAPRKLHGGHGHRFHPGAGRLDAGDPPCRPEATRSGRGTDDGSRSLTPE